MESLGFAICGFFCFLLGYFYGKVSVIREANLTLDHALAESQSALETWKETIAIREAMLAERKPEDLLAKRQEERK